MTLRKHLQRRSLDGSIEALHGLHPLLARIYAARGVSGPNEIEYSLKGLEDVWQSCQAVALLRCLPLLFV
jgi:hypothetical protein